MFCSAFHAHHIPRASVQKVCGARTYVSLLVETIVVYISLTGIVLSTDEFAGKKVVLVSVPGAFTVRSFFRFYVAPV